MSERTIELAVTIAELDEGTAESAYPAMKELRPHLTNLTDFLHLDSGTHRHDAHRRYLSSGLIISALHFSKPVSTA